jgi:hypothetical protein
MTGPPGGALMSYMAVDNPQPPHPRGRYLRWRKMTWALIVWSALIAVWVIGGIIHNETTAARQCAHDAVLGTQICHDAVDAGTGIGVMLVLGFGFLGFVVLSLIWLMTRPREVIVIAPGHGAPAGPGVASVPPPGTPGMTSAAPPAARPRLRATDDSLIAETYRRKRPPAHH